RLNYVVELLTSVGIPTAEAKRRSELLYCTLIGEFLQRTYGKARLGSRALRSFHKMMLMPVDAD
ncbi:MAG: hypothetical protein AAF449_18790, partial [Myxococcota bacterium]